MAIANPTAYRAPWYARTATTAGRPVVLAIALLMCAPGEYHLARLAGWADPWAYGMPAALSAYAGIAAVVAASRPKGARGRASAIVGAGIAIVLALAAQIGAHLIDKGHMVGNQAWLVGLISAVPPAVVGHLLHLAATPAATEPATGPLKPRRLRWRIRRAEAVTPADAPHAPVSADIPPVPTTPPALPAAYRDARCHVIRPLYDSGYRPSTSSMLAALTQAGHTRPDGSPLSGGTVRGVIRAEVESHEQWLAALPPEPSPVRAA